MSYLSYSISYWRSSVSVLQNYERQIPRTRPDKHPVWALSLQVCSFVAAGSQTIADLLKLLKIVIIRRPDTALAGLFSPFFWNICHERKIMPARLKSFIICIFSTSNATLLEWDGVLNAKQPLKALKLQLS